MMLRQTQIALTFNVCVFFGLKLQENYLIDFTKVIWFHKHTHLHTQLLLHNHKSKLKKKLNVLSDLFHKSPLFFNATNKQGSE